MTIDEFTAGTDAAGGEDTAYLSLNRQYAVLSRELEDLETLERSAEEDLVLARGRRAEDWLNSEADCIQHLKLIRSIIDMKNEDMSVLADMIADQTTSNYDM